MKRFLLSIIYLYLAGMLVAQTAPLEILPYPNEVKVHPGHYPFMSCQLVYPNALKNEADYLKQLLLEEHGLIVQHTKQGKSADHKTHLEVWNLQYGYLVRLQ